MSNSTIPTLRNMKTTQCTIPRNKPITKITIHHAAGVISGANMQSWGHNNTGASWNYGIGNDGVVGQLIDEKNRPWTSSSGTNDHQAVTFEVGNKTAAPDWEISAAAWEKLIIMCVDVCKRNQGIKQKNGQPGLYFDGTPNASLTFHYMFANTNCPGPYIKARAQMICDEVNARLNAVSTPAPKPEESEEKKMPEYLERKYAYCDDNIPMGLKGELQEAIDLGIVSYGPNGFEPPLSEDNVRTLVWIKRGRTV